MTGDGAVVVRSSEDPVPSPAAPKSLGSGRAYRAVREVVALLFWIYAISKTFFFDLDHWLLSQYAPSLRWVVDYRFVWYLLILAVLVLIASRLGAIGLILYVAFYPFVLVFWRLPRLLIRLKSWTLALAVLGGIVALARSYKVTIVALACLVLGTVLVGSHIRAFIGVGLVLLFADLLGVYAKAISASLRSSLDVFSSSALDKAWAFIRQPFTVDEKVRCMSVEAMTEGQLQAWTNSLQVAVIYNRACYFMASRLRDVRRSRLLAVVYMLRVLVLFGLNLWVFSFLNLALSRLSPGSFSAAGSPGLFDFVWYTFNALFGNGVAELAPVSSAARVLFMVSLAFQGLILLVVVVFFVTVVQSGRDDERMDEIVREVRTRAEMLEGELGSQFGMSVEQAVETLQSLKAGAIGLIYFFSPELRPKDDASS